MPILVPKMGVLWDFTPILEKYCTTSKCQFLAQKTEIRRMTYRSLKSVHICGAINSDSQCFLLGRTTRKNYPYPLGIWTPSNTWFLGLKKPCIRLGPFESASQTASRLIQPFLQDSQTWPTDAHRHTHAHTHTHTQTDHATPSVTIARM